MSMIESTNDIITAMLFYSGKEEQIEISRSRTIGDLKQSIASMLHINFSNYDLVYKLQSYSDSDNALKLEQIIGEDYSPSFIFRKKDIVNSKTRFDTSVILENFPSFMDVSEQMKLFCSKSKTEVDFHLDYKNNWCKVSFSDPENAFSFVSFITNVKWTNDLYRKLQISMSYSKTKSNSKVFLSQCTTSSKSTKHSDSHYQSVSCPEYQPVITENRRLIKNSLSSGKPYPLTKRTDDRSNVSQSNFLLCSEPYVSQSQIEQKQNAYAKKKWTNNKNFFTRVGNYSLQHLNSKKQQVRLKSEYHSSPL